MRALASFKTCFTHLICTFLFELQNERDGKEVISADGEEEIVLLDKNKSFV